MNDGADLIVVTSIGGADGAEPVAVRALLETAGDGVAAVLIVVGTERPRPATLVAPGVTKTVERALLPAATEGVSVRTRGRICFVSISGDAFSAEYLDEILGLVPFDVPRAVVVPAVRYRELLEAGRLAPDRVVLRVDRDRDETTAALTELAGEEASEWARVVDVITQSPSRLVSRRLLAGATVRDRSVRPGRLSRLRRAAASDRGQATPLVLGAIFVLVLATVALVAIAGAITGKARAQTVADLSALSAARSMKDDLPRLLAPPTLPNGLPNPAHMSKFEYLARARLTAVRIAVSNGASPLRVSVRFPDGLSFAPVRARVSVRSRVESVPGKSTEDWAEARVGVPVSMGSVPAMASGGGYSGPLAERQGQGLRPDVASAFDALVAAAGVAGVSITINSAFRSDAEQAALFAANPDPTWVAPPGTSLHRCATELDLGASDGYTWLRANAGRFGFVQRYSWEEWHYGFAAGPPPCSEAGNNIGATDGSGGAGGGDGSRSAASLPSFVPEQFKRPILASAMKWNVSGALLAAQLYAESNFDPNAGSSAGAQGIAQFIPSTAAAYGLDDPFDPVAAIDAQGHLMSDLLEQFGSPALALAAYNAGPGAVSPCNCIPDYPETQAYVAKILALLGGVGAILPMPFEVELVK